jgi:hypothetical protein
MEQMQFKDSIFNVLLDDEDKKLSGFYEEEKEDLWLIQTEFVDNFSFKISSPPPARRICGFDLFIKFKLFKIYELTIKNETRGRSVRILLFCGNTPPSSK